MMDFREIKLQDKDIFDRYLKEFQPEISEFTFTNLFSWAKPKQHSFAEIKNHIVVRFGKNSFYEPIGDDPAAIMEIILDKVAGAKFERVHKAADRFKAEEDRDNFDYVYSIKELQELKGNKFEAKRNLAKQCMQYGPEVCRLNQDNVHKFFELQKKWCSLRSCEQKKALSHENEAITTALSHFQEFSLCGVCIIIDDNVAGFAVGEHLNDNTFVEHFEKGDTRYKGIYQYLLREFVRAVPEDYSFLNREQDLGIPGIRKAKKSYSPVRMVKKYSVS